MNFHILTLFPEMIESGIHTSILGRALEKGTISVSTVNIRDYTENRHKKVDDYTYGGGAGMLMQAQPVFDAWKSVADRLDRPARVIYVTPQGRVFDQRMAEELAKEDDLILLCGHYEGIDERVLEEIVTDYVSIGDYVLTGGELPAMVMVDAVARLVPGVLHNNVSAETESFDNGLLEYPQYSRPEVWHDKAVPEVLLSGNHKKIAGWRLEQSVLRTKERRPDLYETYAQLEEVYERLKKKKLLHMMMTETIRHGRARLVAANGDGVLLEEMNSRIYMLSAATKEAGEALLSRAEHPEQIDLLVTHQQFLNEAVWRMTATTRAVECVQAVYTRGVKLPEKKELEVKALTTDYLSVVLEHYHTTPDADYLRERLQSGMIYGGFLDGVLAGFIGIHREGSMGILEVFEDYRRRGIGAALEAFLINRLLERGRIPFAQIFTDNDASMRLQQKLGLAISKETLYWNM